MKISLIVAHDNERGIGKDGDLPWHLPDDLKWFKKHTLHKMVVMGRKTFGELKLQPLPKRVNVVMTRSKDFEAKGGIAVHSMQDVLQLAMAKGCEELMITGGGEIYRQFLPIANRLYITKVDTVAEGTDAFFPAINKKEWEDVYEEHHPADDRHEFPFTFHIYERPFR